MPIGTSQPLVITAGKTALADVEKKKPGLGSRTLQDYINAGFKIDSTVTADLTEVRKVSATDYGRIVTMFHNPTLVQQMVLSGMGFGSIGDTVATAGSVVGNLPGQMTGPIGEGLSATLSPLGGIAAVVSALAQPATWLRIGEGILGIVLIAVGIVAVTKSTPVGSAIQSGVTKAAKVIP